MTELGNKLCFESVKFSRLFIICKYLRTPQSAGIQTDANQPKYFLCKEDRQTVSSSNSNTQHGSI